MRSLQLSVQQLQQNFKKAQVAATVQCTGNRRSEMKAVPAPGSSGAQIKGLDWDVGAISTAEWGGVLLRDVLLAAGGCTKYSFPLRLCMVQLLAHVCLRMHAVV
jgi:sulfite oxidase